MVEGNELKGSPMVARIRETTALTVELLTGNSAKIELRPVQPVSATAKVDEKGLSSFALSTTGKFELHFVNGRSSCKLPSDLMIRCGAGYDNRGASCVQQENDTKDLKKVLGVCISVMLIAVALYFGYIARQTHSGFRNAQYMLGSTLLCMQAKSKEIQEVCL